MTTLAARAPDADAQPSNDDGRRLAPATVAALLVPGLLTLYLGFEAGGYFPGSTGLAAAALAVLLVARIVIARRPFEGLGPAGAGLVGAIGLFAAWTLSSGSWSGAHGRALIEFDRVLLYGLCALLMALVARSPRRIAVLLWGVTAAMVVICLAGFVSRALPDLLPTDVGVASARLSFPLTYWNAVGLQAALATILCFGMATSRRQPRLCRVLCSTALPLLAATLVLTFSRGGIAVAAIGLVIYLVLARDRIAVPVAIVCGLAVAVAAHFSYDAELLATAHPTSAAAVDQGRELALVVAACMAAAALGRFALLALERPLARLRVPTAAMAALVVVLVIGSIGAFATFDGAGQIHDRYEAFTHGSTLPAGSSERDRLGEAGNNGRIEHWRVALHAFDADRLHGTGAGTYADSWVRRRRSAFAVNDAHSLYLEVPSELGVVGAALLGLMLLALLGGLATRVRGPDRALWAAPLAAAIAWAVHAGIDWDWEMPALTLWLFAVGGLAVARPRSSKLSALAPTWRASRIALALVIGGLAVTPVAVAFSQQRLDDSVRAFSGGDCDGAISSALGSIDVVPQRAEPFELLGLCDARLGRNALAIAALRQAQQRDPGNWEYAYSTALVRGAAGRDPRPTIEKVKRLNPLEPIVLDAQRRFAINDPRRWRSRALSARLPFQADSRAGR